MNAAPSSTNPAESAIDPAQNTALNTNTETIGINKTTQSELFTVAHGDPCGSASDFIKSFELV
jgi:hypothetical protein